MGGGKYLINKKIVVFIIDGKTRHGGLSDRLRGLFSAYAYCKDRGYEFKVFWTYPFRLQDYLEPSELDWLIKPENMVYDKRLVAFRFFNSYSFVNDDRNLYFKLLDSSKPIVHVYSNVTLEENTYQKLFKELFKPSTVLKAELDKHLAELGDDYVSITFRFIGLLGDFVDRPDLYPELESGELKAEYISHCLDAIRKVRKRHPDVKRVLVTADSDCFLKEALKVQDVYVVTGMISHMDESGNDNTDSNVKTFLDFLLLAYAKKNYMYVYGRMFSGSKFSKTAALIGGKQIERLTEKV